MNALAHLELDELQEIAFHLQEEEIKQRFRITDLDSLNWTLRKLAALEAKRKENDALAQKEYERIRAWEVKVSKEIDDHKQFLTMLIEDYARQQRAADPKWKSTTPYGKVSFRKQQPKWEYDEHKALESVQSNGLDKFIRVKQELDKQTLKASVQVMEDGRVVDVETGNFIEGIAVMEQPEAFKVEIVG
ncbi:host-nuclease inhibitor Gam family protein [Brevibacillus porteri]|uniref:host-nuclease inhibitor Gam family protein n=1 Tax=Brevibacillus porteri TaxID=2126350 RepID=UPI003D1CC661